MTHTVAMMQPYWFPYLGYFQLIAAADVFVLGDDLQYVKDGWINRNRILCNGEPQIISLPLRKAPHGLAINQRELAGDAEAAMGKLLRTLGLHYARAPYCKQVIALLEPLLLHPQQNLARYLGHTLRGLCAYLQIDTPIVVASALPVGAVTDKQHRVIRTLQCVGGSHYLNPIGGLDLYDPDYFAAAGMSLEFHRMNPVVYPQLREPFVPSLSIIDVLMFNPAERIRAWLPDFTRVPARAATGYVA
ncbi:MULTISPECIES: WbqC family protein [unclassified Pseudomonas]|uniref:WbqC family protein n=1 Tax=unclassified Pseudomonas TaxID=196821 RepID=UPI000BC7BCB1|nr:MULTISPECIES: WbqC family protein [unclassified Pseudomonas]PVZ15713.1 WbqC-like protein [Pseudomonas sp. URIL14HWK12:I12]PVZ25087.1 WbqC-like protein [Pseudomonas sp. URIL14HWK12:I10]PVZ34933.1 WbqC-like protein [Pseudomonas sp. URIL14HWK12:I11]SNZ09706.1 WbqC-like protein family protein [Pseudomonas sp. URIL14HWK12:I9]